ncbi:MULTISPECIES: bifunctional aconitate hydratase 2/2-methylisocitrate dehydratase [Cylindrospermopsis]|jgi:aconitate hydratase 2/2-methylisocitrate dehydratase|uniref:bifunctional aconitate hydratase 2/2-methylisocitrate dehydratase n=1 Tax=Cylindrospermopsis TaxID=77021 RepID=UPI00070AA4D5|nr:MULTISPECIES: bifunctional aconitate hydratase 2/2-methylisocitrate dehydratase [Cylindrospermopsis]KRH95759.1 aconitate hydratase B [Cylindrospermopsis sp. CR12]MBU6344409.1 bifunctional aconitate hydratase 2/2-methylisocitrate dehydratase [Cyanobacteria bacterium REEB494]TPX27233.1 bifunctional aconitate hydratase 2/2-methylisocitrate dehydratase [Cylindrospermopsis raciborskii GIHE 2018]UJL33665.1 bifunctional aconitate hydratase 2/2-methylisocitrate dehydratase [Cylindrospermopsis racibo
MLAEYQRHTQERGELGIPPLPLNVEQTSQLCELLKNPPAGKEELLLHLLRDRIPPGVDQSAYIKAGFLTAVAKQEITSPLISPLTAVELLGTMVGGYNVQSLINLLSSPVAEAATTALSKILLVYDSFNDVLELSQTNSYAKQVIDSWSAGEWFTSRPTLADQITVTVFKVPGETNTDDLSPATHATTRPDIPLHALAMLETRQPGSLETIAQLKQTGYPIAYVGDVVGTGSSRKSAINSVLWHIGNDIPFVPNKRAGGYILGGAIAPIFFNTAEDAGALPIQCDVTQMETGDIITIHPYQGEITKEGKIIATFNLKPDTILDEVRAGGRIPLLIGRTLTDKTRQALSLAPSDLFIRPQLPKDTGKGYTLAQKMVGRACGLPGVRPGTSCEPIMTTVGSQDTTGPMTRDELKELACLGFSADLVMQSFCHTAAYPKPVDVKTHQELPDFFASRGGVALRPGDGIIHSWLNRMLLPDTVGTGGDSHTRFPLGISFPAGSGLVAFAGALGVMPLDMPESVLVRFKGELQPGVTLRDIVNAIPYVAIQKGLLTVEKKNKKNIFSGRIMEIEGLPDLKVEQAFELTDASAERSCAGCTIKLSEETIAEYLRSNIALLKNMVARGYGDGRTIMRRVAKMEAWLANPILLTADPNAEYAEVIEINLNDIKEPIVAAPNDPDNVKLLSAVANDPVQEVFVGSCMTNIGHYRATAKVLEGAGQVKARLWIAPPTRMDEYQLKQEKVYDVFVNAHARTEVPGCSLCMGNQARVEDNTTVFSTSTRNFNNRMGNGAQVYLGSAELAAVCALLGRIPTVEEYMSVVVEKINPFADNLYRYLNFDQITGFEDQGRVISKEQQATLI